MFRLRRIRVGLLGKFALVSLVPIVLLGLTLAHFVQIQIRERALADAVRSAELVARLGVQPHLSKADISQGLSSKRLQAVDQAVRTSLLGRDVSRIKIWSPDSRVVYADDGPLIGRTFPTSHELQEALGGEVESEISDLRKAENVAERRFGQLLEVYVPLRFGQETAPAGVFELYVPYTPIADEIARDTRKLYLVLAAGLLLLYAALFSIVRQARRHEYQAITDALTGLGNRRKLLADLDYALAASNGATPTMLVIFDLDGFKSYNDTFGHPAGDLLLTRLGNRLQGVAEPFGRSYRLGGDEFCVLAAVPIARTEAFLSSCEQALFEEGNGFEITTSLGAVFLADEATEPREALRIADQRLYAQKHAHRLAHSRAHEALLGALFERAPDLQAHVSDVVAFSIAVGWRLDLSADELRQLELAAELHDIGKLALPDSILRKPGPLDETEWKLVRQHTVVGQRILSAVPFLHGVGEIVRHTHEHWDGEGYADGLAGGEIPLAARIIAVCDAYSAMTSERPYRLAMTAEQAFEELRRCAGTQFDPEIVEVFCELFREDELRERLRTPPYAGSSPAEVAAA